MFKNYVTTALRNLRKHSFYSLINILGLSIGLSCFILIAVYVQDEMSYDQMHSDLEHIYRMDFAGNINGSDFNTALASVPAAATMKSEFPEVTETVRLRGQGDRLIKWKKNNQNFKEELVTFADPNFFQFFDFKVISGDVATMLERPNTIAISESVAKKIFGDEDPIGQEVSLDNRTDYEVTGIFADMPSQSHMHWDLILSMEGLEEARMTQWMSFNFQTYLKLQPGTDPNTINAKFPALIEKYIGPEVEQFMGASLEEFYEAGNKAGYTLFPMKDIHLHSAKLGDIEANGDMKYVYIFSAVAIFILLLACINFMNLATARSASRAKEVGVRKTMGAYRSNLIKQFLAEAILICLIAFGISVALSSAVLPLFEELSDKTLAMGQLFSPVFLGTMIIIMVVVGMLAGSYPALYLSRFKPVEVLKGKLNLGMKSGGIRSVLVVLQFSISIIMIVGTAIVFDQLNYIQNKKLGFDKDQVIMIHDAWLLDDNINAFKTEALRNSNIISGTIANFLPVGTTNNNNAWFAGKTTGTGNTYVFNNYGIDLDYMETLGMEITEGRNFSAEFPADTTKVLINEAAVAQLGYEKPIGEYISTFGGSRETPETITFQIIGIVKDFHFNSMKKAIDPLVFTLDERRGFASFKLSANNIDQTIASLEQTWEQFAPSQPFEYSFLDDRFNRIYENEQRIGDIFGVFAFLSIFIACLGLYGLASFTAEQRRKEIGIRKVLGASVPSILALLSKEFIKLVVISFVLAAPVAYIFMNEWLTEFEYRTELKPLTFFVSGVLALFIAWLTMSSQTYLAAKANPATSLKDE
ncbi:MAG: ABC transporter permease [Cytophagales bacterium]|nr:ABC transporter permease [Cytophagales bacterium]